MVRSTAVSFSVLLSLAFAPLAAHSAATTDAKPVGPKASVPAGDCKAQVDKQKLTGAARQSAMSRCMKAVTSPTSPNPQLQTSAITSPSGASPSQRAGQCSAEADRRGLKLTARQSFQHNCLSGIGPVTSIGTALHPPAKGKAVKGLGEVSNGQQH